MGDGYRDSKGKGLLLCTDSFKVEEVVMLINVLTCYAGRFNCTLRFYRTSETGVYIRTKLMSTNLLR